MGSNRNRHGAWDTLCAGLSPMEALEEFSRGRVIFQQGQPADSVFYLRRGKVKLAVVSEHGREAVVALLGAGDFFGEGCLAGQRLRRATATAMLKCTVGRIQRRAMSRLLRDRHEISEWFVERLLSRNMRYEADLLCLMFNSAEKRLARLLLLLSNFGEECRAKPLLPRLSRADLAHLVGTSQSRVSHFLNKFKASGFVDHAAGGGLRVHKGLLNVVLHD